MQAGHASPAPSTERRPLIIHLQTILRCATESLTRRRMEKPPSQVMLLLYLPMDRLQPRHPNSIHNRESLPFVFGYAGMRFQLRFESPKSRKGALLGRPQNGLEAGIRSGWSVT